MCGLGNIRDSESLTLPLTSNLILRLILYFRIAKISHAKLNSVIAEIIGRVDDVLG